MKTAKVKFHILMEYETTVQEQQNLEYPEDNMTLNEAIIMEKFNLQEYREDLGCALDDAKLLKVTLEETEHCEVQEFVNDFSI